MDFYLILGIERAATLADVKRAYRRLARRYHPDINPGDPAAAAVFRQVVEAYETLVDPTRRRRYDSGESQPTPGPGGSVEFEGFDFSVQHSPAAGATFSELFAEAFAGRSAHLHERARQGADLHVALTLSFDESVRGGQHPVTVTRLDTCLMCRGGGRLSVADARCPACAGSGSLRVVRGHMVFSMACGSCAGTGRLPMRPCPSCGGEGVHPRSEIVRVAVPAGIRDGTRLRVAGMGHVGRLGGRAGDLYADVRVEPHPVFRREGDDLHVTVSVAIHEAALGARIDVMGLDGPVRVSVPPGAQSGQRVRLRGRGVAAHGRCGDLLVEWRLMLPPMLDERSKELLREFGRLNPGDVRAPSPW